MRDTCRIDHHVETYDHVIGWIQFCNDMKARRERKPKLEYPIEERQIQIGVQCARGTTSRDTSKAALQGIFIAWHRTAKMLAKRRKLLSMIIKRNALRRWAYIAKGELALIRMQEIFRLYMLRLGFNKMVDYTQMRDYKTMRQRRSIQNLFDIIRRHFLQKAFDQLERNRRYHILRNLFELWEEIYYRSMLLYAFGLLRGFGGYLRKPSKYVSLNYRAITRDDENHSTVLLKPKNKRFHDTDKAIHRNRFNDSMFLLRRVNPMKPPPSSNTQLAGLWRENEVILTKSFTPEPSPKLTKTFWV